MKSRHFFFKFKKGNIGFKQFLKYKDYVVIEVPLPIYFGPWTIEKYLNEKESIDFGNSRQKKHRIRQVETFFNLVNSTEDIFFWIFLPDDIYCVKLIKPYQIFELINNQPEYMIDADKDGSVPKYFLGSIFQKFKKDDLPECFANINTNQKYNRRTIFELNGNELFLANFLTKGREKPIIPLDKRLFFLSPIQFETLIFLIFVEHKIYCSTFRGGTKEKYDLKIDNDSNIFSEFKNGIVNIQIKMKTDFVLPKSDENTIFIYLGDNNIKSNLFGREWIISKISGNEYINKWLNKSLEFFLVKEEFQ